MKKKNILKSPSSSWSSLDDYYNCNLIQFKIFNFKYGGFILLICKREAFVCMCLSVSVCVCTATQFSHWVAKLRVETSRPICSMCVVCARSHQPNTSCYLRLALFFFFFCISLSLSPLFISHSNKCVWCARFNSVFPSVFFSSFFRFSCLFFSHICHYDFRCKKKHHHFFHKLCNYVYCIQSHYFFYLSSFISKHKAKQQ